MPSGMAGSRGPRALPPFLAELSLAIGSQSRSTTSAASWLSHLWLWHALRQFQLAWLESHAAPYLIAVVRGLGHSDWPGQGHTLHPCCHRRGGHRDIGHFSKKTRPPEGCLAKGDVISQKQGQDLDLAALFPSRSRLLLMKTQMVPQQPSFLCNLDLCLSHSEPHCSHLYNGTNTTFPQDS